MSEIKVEVIFPMSYDLQYDEDFKYPFIEKYKLLKELGVICSNFQLELHNYHLETSAIVSIEKDIPNEYYNDFLSHGFIGLHLKLIRSEFLKLSITTPFDYNKINLNINPPEGEFYDSVHSFIAQAIQEKVFELLIVSQIAKPGSLVLDEGIILVNGKKYYDIYGTPLLRDAYSYSQKIKYPPIAFLNFQDVYKWFREKKLLLQYEPKSKMQIALNAFTYLFDKEASNEINLIYTLMALEALYTKGNNNVTEQLNEKVQIYLGSVLSYKKNLKNMYAIRSRYLHGDLPIGPIDHVNVDVYPKHADEILDASYLSTMILIATFQKMFLEDRTSLDFEYKLK